MSCQSYSKAGRRIAVGDVFHEIDGGDWRVDAIQFDSGSEAIAACVSDQGEPRLIAVVVLFGSDFYQKDTDRG